MTLHDPTVPIPPALADAPLPDDQLSDLFDQAAEADADIIQVVEETREHWEIEDLGAAEWAMRHAAEATRVIRDLKDQRNDWAERIDLWFEQATKREQVRLAFMEHHLKEYALKVRAESKDHQKSVVLPSGTVGTRSAKAAIEVYNADEVLDWAAVVGVLDEVAPPKRTVKKSALKDLVRFGEVTDVARVVMEDGTLVWWVRDGWERPLDFVSFLGEEPPLESEADPTELPEVVEVHEVVASHLVVVDASGELVPGAGVRDAHIDATVTPS
jgi:hypothetical protein